MRVLVTGASGGLGRYVVAELRAFGHETLIPSSTELPVHIQDGVARYMRDTARLDGIVHLAGLANVDRCSDEPELAMDVNALGAWHIARAAQGRIPLAYASTNDVFSECDGGPFGEDRTPVPGMPYSWSKLCGEMAIVGAGGFAVRANFFTRKCNAKQSFVDYVLTSTQEGKKFNCYTNVQATPVHASTLARTLVDGLLSHRSGVLHLCTSDYVHRGEQAEKILTAYGLPTDGIVPVEMINRRGRPLDARLTSMRGGIVGTVDEEIQKLVQAEPL